MQVIDWKGRCRVAEPSRNSQKSLGSWPKSERSSDILPRRLPAPRLTAYSSNPALQSANLPLLPSSTMTRNSLHSKALSSPLGSIDEEGDSILDESILDDSHSLDMAGTRFDSQPHAFSSPHFLAHGDETWQNFPTSQETPSFHPINPQPASTYLSSYQSQGQPGNPAHYAAFTEHPAPWQPINIDAKPHQALSDGVASQYDLKTEDSQHTTSMPPPMMNGVEQYAFASSMASPQSENGWLSASSSSETKKTPKREAISRQSYAAFPQHLRREGIRKKNARVEIPEGRTIDTIEEEIRLCDPNDEAKLKELKQFKRLLRNREAAYVFSRPTGTKYPVYTNQHVDFPHDHGRRNTLKDWKKRTRRCLLTSRSTMRC